MAKILRLLIVLGTHAHIPDLIRFARGVAQAMAGHPEWFPSPTPPLSTFSQQINELETAETAAQTRARGTAGARDIKAGTVRASLEYLASYVQQVADANAAQAESIIKGAGMSTRENKPRAARNDLVATQGELSGMAILLVKSAGGKAAYEWQMSLDLKTWIPLATTVLTKNIIQGLTPATTYNFRYRAITTAGAGEWSQIVSLLVT
jgi:hypothetical protein